MHVGPQRECERRVSMVEESKKSSGGRQQNAARFCCRGHASRHNGGSCSFKGGQARYEDHELRQQRSEFCGVRDCVTSFLPTCPLLVPHNEHRKVRLSRNKGSGRFSVTARQRLCTQWATCMHG